MHFNEYSMTKVSELMRFDTASEGICFATIQEQFSVSKRR